MKHLNLRRIWAVIVMVIMVLQLLPAAAIAETIDDEAAVVEAAEDAVEQTEAEPAEEPEEPAEPAEEPEEPAEPAEEPEEPAEPAEEPEEPAVEPEEPIVEPDEPVVDPEEPIVEPDEPAVEPEEPEAEPEETKAVPFTVDWNDYTITVEGAPEDAEIRVQDAENYMEALQQMTETETVETLFALSLSKENVKLDEKATVTVSGKALNELADDAVLAEIDETDTAKAVDFDYTAQAADADASITFRTSALDRFALILPGEATAEPMGDDAVTDDQTDPEPTRGIEPYVADHIQKTWGQQNVEVGNGITYDWSIGWDVAGDASVLEYDEEGRLVFHPSTWIPINGIITVEVKVNPPAEPGAEAIVPAGAIEITIPRYIFYQWNDDEVNPDARMIKSDYSKNIIALELAPNHGAPIGTNSYQGISKEQSGIYNYYYEEVGDKIVIHNWNAIASGTFSTQIGYSTDPLNVNGGHPIDNAHDHTRETEWWKDYTDYYENDLPVTFRMDADLNGENEVDYTGKLGVAVMTRATSAYQAKPMPIGKEELSAPNSTSTLKSGVVFAWDKTWGEKPSDADDYFYVVWNVNYGSGHHVNYPPSASTTFYNFSQGWEATIDALNEDNYIEVDGEIFPGEVVSTLQFAGCHQNAIPNTTATFLNSQEFATSLKGLASGNTTNNGYMTTMRGNFFRKVFYRGAICQNYAIRDVYNGDGKNVRGTGNHYAFLIRYPKTAIAAVGYERMRTEGLTVNALFHIKETWDSNYVVRDTVAASTHFTLDPIGGKGKFSKEVGSTAYRTSAGGQSALLNGKSVKLDNSTGGTHYPSWKNYLSSISATAGSNLVGQHIEMTDTWDSTLFISSSKASNAHLFSASDTELLTEDDYQFNGIYFNYVREYGADCLEMPDANGDMTYTWVMHADYDTDYQNQKPVLIYIRLRGETEFVPYCAVYRTTSSAVEEAYLWDGGLDENGLPVKGDKLNQSWGRFPMPEGTVQIRMEHDSDFYRCDISWAVDVTILPTEHVQEIVQRHVDNEALTYIRNVTRYNTSPLHTEGMSSEMVSALSDSGTNYNPNGNASNDTYILAPITSTLTVEKTSSTPTDLDAYQQEATANGYKISYILLRANNKTNISNSIAVTTDWEDPYKMLEGTFYELLPKGTNVQAGSVFGYLNLDYWNGGGGAPNSGLSYQPTGAGNYRLLESKKGYNLSGLSSGSISRYWFKDTDYTCTTIPDWNGTGRTMLQIDYKVEDMNITDSYYLDPSWRNDVCFYFIMENPIDNIGVNGQYTVNPMGFVNRTEDGVSKPAVGYSAAEKIPDDVKAGFVAIGEENERAVFNQHTINWRAVTTTETGFAKAVKALPETVNGIEAISFYKAREIVSLGKDYIYRLRYRTESGTNADSIVFYDILESGVAGENGKTSADWRGTFVSVDTIDIEQKVSVTSETGAKCAPVVYYSTTLVCKNSENGDYFDLTDSSKWTTERPSGTITAIAVDCSNAENDAGEKEPFTIGPEDTMYVYIRMTAPAEYTEGEVFNGAVVSARPHADNGGAGSNSHNGETSTRALGDVKKLRHEASVLLRDIDVELHKASNPKTGTSEARTQVKADGTGTIVYRLTVRNDMPFDAENVVITDPIPEGLTVDHVTVKLNGASTETDASTTAGFTYEQSGQTCTFTIAKQYPTVLDENDAVVTNKDTEIYIYTTVDELKDAQGKQVLLRDYDNTATLVEANNKELNEKSETTYHRAETTLIPVEKIWDDDNDRDGLRPTTIDVTLTGKAGEDTVVTETTTLKESNDWKDTFENLPKYDIDDENTDFDVPTTYTEIVYTLSEEQVEHYEEPVIDNENYTITNKHVPEVTEVSANKKWKNADGTVVPPAGAKVTYTLYADGQPTTYKVELKGAAGTAPTTMGGYESEAWTAKFVNLPKYRDHGVEIVYTIAETVTYGGYTPSTTEPVANGGTITNEQETTEVSANKKWKNANGTVVPPEGAKVTYTLYADGQPTTYTVELKGEAGTAPTVTGGYESVAWTAKFVNLPKYKPGTTTRIVYTIAETVTYGGYTPSTTAPVANGGTITNEQETTEISANKKWKNLDGTVVPPEGAKVTYTLYADGVATQYTVELKGEVGTAPTVTGGYESEAWTAKFVNLPKYKAGTDTEIVYTIGETVTYPGYAPDKTQPVGNGETITNEQKPFEVSANKKWKNADGTVVPPEGATVTYTLYADGVATQYTVELKGEAGTKPTVTGGYESEAWTASFVNLPKYKAGTDTEIVYTIAETVTYKGYTPSTTEPVADGGTITNTQDTTEVSANKKWKNADGTVVPPEGAKVTYTLYADGQPTTYTVVLKGEAGTAPRVTGGYESEAWTAKFVNLPKFKAGTDTEIVYTIAETVTYGGYTPSTTEPVANGGTITNEQDTTEVSANKKWKNADGTVVPPEGATVTYTLYADGQPTTYTVELKGEAGTAPTVTGGYESEAWTAKFVNLPKYQAGTDTEIVYTIAETVTYGGYTPDTTEPVANGGTITNEQDTTEVSANKKWKNADGTVVPPEGATVTYTLYADGQPTEYTVELSGTIGTEPEVTGGYESEEWTAKFVNLPKFKAGTDTEIVYTIGETVTYKGYTPDTTEPVANGGTITNEQDTTEVSAHKAWLNADETTTPPEGATVTYTLYADGVATEYTVELSGTIGTEPEVTGGYESEEWTAKFVNLPKYQAGTDTEIVYTIGETVTYPGYTPDKTEPVADGETITNVQEKTQISVHKAWKNADGTVVPPEGAKVTYTLYADGTETEYAVELSGAVGEKPEGTGGYESVAWTASFVNLPKYKIVDGAAVEIVYTVKETVTYVGYTPDKVEVADGETITNEQETTEISVHKAWDDKVTGSTTPPEGATVTFTLYADGVATEYTVELKGEAGTAPTVTGGYESVAWTAKFVNLPKYKTGTDTEIVYTVAETVTYNEYVPDKTDPVADGETITNIRYNRRGSIEVRKVWKDDNNFEGDRPSSITIRLYADGVEVRVETLTAANGWYVMFMDMPILNEEGNPIVYSISEDEVYAYTTEIELNGEYSFVVTNTHVVQTGDNAKPWLWVSILSLAVLAGAAMLILERKSRKQRSN